LITWQANNTGVPPDQKSKRSWGANLSLYKHCLSLPDVFGSTNTTLVSILAEASIKKSTRSLTTSPRHISSAGWEVWLETTRNRKMISRKPPTFYHTLIPTLEWAEYHWLPVWLVWNQLYYRHFFLFLFAKQTDPNQLNRRSTVQYYFSL